MPLSEEERRRLAELESGLTEDDPELAKELEAGPAQVRQPDTSGCKLALLAGLLLILVGSTGQLPVIGITGFLLMFAGACCLLKEQRSRKRN